jgi:hypothetical protein
LVGRSVPTPDGGILRTNNNTAEYGRHCVACSIFALPPLASRLVHHHATPFAGHTSVIALPLRANRKLSRVRGIDPGIISVMASGMPGR